MQAVSDEFLAARLPRRAAAVAVVWCCAAFAAAAPSPGTPEAARYAATLFAGAEERFQPPSESRFAETQQALKAEVDRVSREFDANPAATVFWKGHLRWELLERNLGPRATVSLSELQLVRRWMYSNRKGLESPFFAPLRSLMDAYLDAVFTFSEPDLRASFLDHVALARRQCLELADDPLDAKASALGRTLAWFERTRQLESEVAAVRSLTSLPNAQLVVASDVVRRIVAGQAIAISETIPLSEQVPIPPSGRLQRARTMQVQGSATTRGDIQIKTTPNDRVAEVKLDYHGTVDSTARGQTGSVTIRLTASGTAEAVKSVYYSPQGLELGPSTVMPHVTSRVAGVSADSEIVERIAVRRTDQPDSRSLMNAKARSTTIEQLTAKLDQRVEEAIEEIRSEFARLRSTLGQFGEATAPFAREGVTFSFDNARSSASAIELNAYSRRREQPGAASPCPIDSIAADILVRIHVSSINNVAETITGGKTLSDEFVMKYAKVVHAELPLKLMVHSRAPRWALTMAAVRPIELRIPEANRFAFVVRVDAIEIDGVKWSEPTTATISYNLLQDEFGEYRLQRVGGVQLESTLPEEPRNFLQEKIDAFFGPVLNGDGMVVPDGGALGALRHLQSKGVRAEREWIVAGWDVPLKVVDELLKSSSRADSAK